MISLAKLKSRNFQASFLSMFFPQIDGHPSEITAGKVHEGLTFQLSCSDWPNKETASPLDHFLNCSSWVAFALVSCPTRLSSIFQNPENREIQHINVLPLHRRYLRAPQQNSRKRDDEKTGNLGDRVKSNSGMLLCLLRRCAYLTGGSLGNFSGQNQSHPPSSSPAVK